MNSVPVVDLLHTFLSPIGDQYVTTSQIQCLFHQETSLYSLSLLVKHLLKITDYRQNDSANRQALLFIACDGLSGNKVGELLLSVNALLNELTSLALLPLVKFCVLAAVCDPVM